MDAQNLTPAGFMPTREEYAQARRVAENLAAQVEVKDSTIATLERALAAAPQLCRCADEVRCALVAERDAARVEVARLTAALENIKAEFDGRAAGVLASAALRGKQASAQCPKCGHPMSNHDDVVGCFEYECECDVIAPAQKEN